MVDNIFRIEATDVGIFRNHAALDGDLVDNQDMGEKSQVGGLSVGAVFGLGKFCGDTQLDDSEVKPVRMVRLE